MYNVLKIWHIKEIKKNFFFHLYIWKWTEHLITQKLWEESNHSSERKKERKKEREKKRKKKKKERKQKYLFPFIYFSMCIYENELGESASLLTLF